MKFKIANKIALKKWEKLLKCELKSYTKEIVTSREFYSKHFNRIQKIQNTNVVKYS